MKKIITDWGYAITEYPEYEVGDLMVAKAVDKDHKVYGLEDGEVMEVVGFCEDEDFGEGYLVKHNGDVSQFYSTNYVVPHEDNVITSVSHIDRRPRK